MLWTGPSPAGDREAGEGKARAGKRQSWPQRGSSTKLQAGFQLLTKTSWDSGWLTSTGRVTARDELPRRDTRHT